MIEESVQKQLREHYNPDGSDLRMVQLSLLDILVEFDRVCKTNDVNYWLDSGTLLGAVRHGGFIPWDDDLDVCMLREDYLKYRKVIKKELKSPCRLCDADLLNNNRLIYPRVINESVMVKRMNVDGSVRKDNLWLDIFPMIHGTALFARSVNKLYGRCFRRKYRVIDDGWIKHCTGVVAYPFVRMLVGVLRFVGQLVDRGNLDHDFGVGFYSKRHLCDVIPLGTVSFEGHLFPAPVDCDAYLKRLFGDYMTLPDENGRGGHEMVFDSNISLVDK